jgi:superfamily II DNA or RNA helicase
MSFDYKMSIDAPGLYVAPVDNIYVLLMTHDIDIMETIRKYFTISVKNAKWMPQVRAGNWDGKIRLIKTDGRMPKGLLFELVKICKQWEIPICLHDDLRLPKIDLSDFREVIKKGLIDKQKNKRIPWESPWEHQEQIALKLIRNKYCVGRSATSSGKSYIICMVIFYLLYKGWAKNVLLVVPKIDLVGQMSDDFEEYGLDPERIGIYFGRKKDSDKEILIATWQSLQHIKETQFFRNFDCVIIDETHLAKYSDKQGKGKQTGTIIRQILDKCVNAEWRFGVTGTMPDDRLDYLTIVSALGPVVSEVKAKSLMEKGSITDLLINVVQVGYKNKSEINKKIQDIYNDKLEESNKNSTILKYIAEKEFIENHIPRLKLLATKVEEQVNQNKNVLLLVDKIEYGERLVKVFKHICKGASFVEYIQGEMAVEERKDIRLRMENSTRNVIIATISLFSTGISVKNLHTVIFSHIGKAKISVLQSIGRSLRKHDSKEMALIIDMVDDLRYTKKQAEQRMNFYADEEFDIEFNEVEI